MDALLRKMPTKVIIGLVSNEAFSGTWHQFHTYGLEFGLPGCGCMTTTSQALTAGLWARHVCRDLPASGMYPSDWSNGMSAKQFVGGSMLLSWDLTPDDREGVANLSPRCLGMVKVSLRFGRPLLATTSLIPYAQYDNLVVIGAYHTVTFNYNMWCSAGNF